MAQHSLTPSKPGRSRLTWFLIGAVVLLTASPWFLRPGADFSGTDNLASQAISQMRPAAQPWFQPLWTPPNREAESLLFALQAAVGAGVVGYYIGYKRGQKR